MWLNVTNAAICAENLKLKFWNLSQWDTAGEESADLTALCSLPHRAPDSARTTDGHPFSSVYCQHELLRGPSDCVAAVTGEDKMHLQRWKGEKCPQANACLVPRGVLQEPLTRAACQGSAGQLQRSAGRATEGSVLTGTPGDTSFTPAQQPTLLPNKALSPQMNPHLKQQQTNKARKLHVLQSPLTCSPFMWLTI